AFRAARIARRLTQQYAARHAGVSVATISRLERGDLLELGVVKLISLFGLVGLDLTTRPKGHTRTLDDIQRENSLAKFPGGENMKVTAAGAVLQAQQRVRRTKAELALNPAGEALNALRLLKR
ncbi:MAG: helix-turn-helix domain-containing protein, partial [Rhodocyclaceae bacterium]|nr:helix-turn-helix domain-containing protein [Rhodocyclaceae bacterium]